MSFKSFFKKEGTSEAKEFNIDSWAIENGIVLLGDDLIALKEFLKAAAYVLTKNDIEKDNDPRLEFIEWIKSLQARPLIHSKGTNAKSYRLESRKKLFSTS